MKNCEFCFKVYSGKNAGINLKKHLIHCVSNPNSIRYLCDICEKEFEKRHSLCAHKRFCGKFYKKKEKKKTIHKTICKYCGYISENGLKLGGHISNCNLNPNYENRINKLIEISKNRKHSDKTKKLISESRIKFLEKNPDKVPYKLNHSSKESYPEIYFSNLFKNEGIIVERYYRVGLYELDFCIVDKKIDIEIDGEQHYLDKKILNSDLKRNLFLESSGWKIIRIRWSLYQKMKFEEKEKFILELKSFITN